MREIKFRAWDGNKMQYSELPPSFAFWKYVSYDSDCLKTLMQYTGLKDKNGVEIYEGDIMQLKSRYPHDFQEKHPHKKYNRISNGVKYSLEYGAFLLDDTFEREPAFCGFDENKQWEVIGNIYENPELIEK